MAAANTPTRAALHGTVTVLVVALRVTALVAQIAADVLRGIADTIAAGRDLQASKKQHPAEGQLPLQ